jgi:hypothetical protein
MGTDASRHDIDAVIDDTARAMTEGMPTGSLRDGVRARIAGGVSASTTAPGAWAWRLGLAAASIAIVVVGVARNVSDPLPAPVVRQPAQDIALETRTDSDGARVEVVDGNAPPRIAASARRRADTARTGSTARGFQTAPPDEPPEDLPFPAMELETVAIEPMAAEPVTLVEIELPMPLQVQRLNIDPVILE